MKETKKLLFVPPQTNNRVYKIYEKKWTMNVLRHVLEAKKTEQFDYF